MKDRICLEWGTRVQPLIDDVCASVEAVMRGGAANMFQKHSPVDLYALVYDMTAQYQRDFSGLAYMRMRQVDAVSFFCKRFRADGLATLNQHLYGIDLLVRWFGCFFHHLNISWQRVCATAEQDMMAAARSHYFLPQKDDILSWFRVAWSTRRVDAYALEVLRAVETMCPDLHAELSALYISCARSYYAPPRVVADDAVDYMKSVVDCLDEEERVFLTYFRGHDPVGVRGVLQQALVFPRQDALVGVWGQLVEREDVGGARVFSRFFSWSSCQEAWVDAHKDFAVARVRSQHAARLDAFLRSQFRFLDLVFDNPKWRLVFVRVVEESVRGAFTPVITTQWVKESHRRLSTGRPATMLDLIPYCPDRDDLHAKHHALFRSRLLSGSFRADHELAVLDVFERVFGASFVLNTRLMTREFEEELSSSVCGVRRLSRVVWGLSGCALRFRPPPFIESGLLDLHDQWRRETNPSVRLELLPLEGSVKMTSGHVMSPVQAIVLLALPSTRQGLAAKLGVPDDDAHNLTNILDSLERSGLIVCRDDQWCHAPVLPPPSFVHAPLPASSLGRDGNGAGQAVSALEAFIVRTLKKNKKMSLIEICRGLAPQVPAFRVRGLVDGLVRRDYLAWHNGDQLVYLP